MRITEKVIKPDLSKHRRCSTLMFIKTIIISIIIISFIYIVIKIIPI